MKWHVIHEEVVYTIHIWYDFDKWIQYRTDDKLQQWRMHFSLKYFVLIMVQK